MNLTGKILDSDSPDSLAARARARRTEKLRQEFPELERMHVVDLGGTPAYWEASSIKPASVVTVNLIKYASTARVTAVTGDACDPPDQVWAKKYDLVISNSVLEHVGGHAKRAQFAETVKRLAPAHWVQTPYRYFAIEPHWLFPGLQFLPFRTKVWVTQKWPAGHMHTTSEAQAVDSVNEVELISRTQMKSYFPQSTIWAEKIAGLIKSITAIKQSG